MSTSKLTLNVGQVARATAQSTYDGRPVQWTGGSPVWETDNRDVVTLRPDPSGLYCDVVGSKPGNAVVTVTGRIPVAPSPPVAAVGPQESKPVGAAGRRSAWRDRRQAHRAGSGPQSSFGGTNEEEESVVAGEEETGEGPYNPDLEEENVAEQAETDQAEGEARDFQAASDQPEPGTLVSTIEVTVLDQHPTANDLTIHTAIKPGAPSPSQP